MNTKTVRSAVALIGLAVLSFFGACNAKQQPQAVESITIFRPGGEAPLTVVTNSEEIERITSCLQRGTSVRVGIVAGDYLLEIKLVGGRKTLVLVGGKMVKTEHGIQDLACNLSTTIERLLEAHQTEITGAAPSAK